MGGIPSVPQDRTRTLKERDRARWWKSWESVTETAGAGFLNWFLAVVPGKRGYPKLVTQFLEQQEEQFGSMTDMDEHNSHVKAITPASNFHMVELSEGWAPLCKMLGAPIPDEPFPKRRQAVEGLAGVILKEAGMRWSAIFALAGVAGYGAWQAWKWGM